MAKKKKSKKSMKASGKSKMKKSAKGASKSMKLAPKKMGPTPPAKPVLVSPKNSNSRQYTQGEFLECIRGCCGFTTRREAKEFYNDFASMITVALKSGYKIMLPGIGKMQVRRTKARMGRNPMTQEQIMIPARKKVAFTATKALKEAVL